MIVLIKYKLRAIQCNMALLFCHLLPLGKDWSLYLRKQRIQRVMQQVLLFWLT